MTVSGPAQRYWFLDPYPVPSHQAVRDTYIGASRLDWQIEALPADGWKWRMRTAAAVLAERIGPKTHDGDVIVTTSMLDASTLRGLLPNRVRIIVYMHENQLTYARSTPTMEMAVRHLHSCLAADAIVFNSCWHQDGFWQAMSQATASWPNDAIPEAAARLSDRSVVIYPGVVPAPRLPKDGPPMLLWNHRWCPEKRPDRLLTLLRSLRRNGQRFRLALTGSPNYRIPDAITTIRSEFADELVACGYLDRPKYQQVLGMADVVISTADEENFGLAVAESIASGAWPVLPARLSYPEVLPAQWHSRCLYDGPDELLHQAVRALSRSAPEIDGSLANEMTVRFSPDRMAAELDDLVAKIVA